MRIVLVHNEKAGSGVSADEVCRFIEAAGHQIVAQAEAGDRIRDMLTADTDLLAVAGGDGTVRSIGLQVTGSGVPLAVIPLGTANNIASSLGIEGEPGEVVKAWTTSRRLPLDIGVARGSWGVQRFLESAGGGLIALGIAAMHAEAPHPEEGDRYEMLRKAVRRFGDLLADMRPRACHFSLDGKQYERHLLLIEVLNISSVGPRLSFAPTSRPADGLFDVVIAEEEQRADLAAYLRENEHGRSKIHLPTRSAARVSLAGWDVIHLDGQVLPTLDREVTIEVERAALEVLAPVS